MRRTRMMAAIYGTHEPLICGEQRSRQQAQIGVKKLVATAGGGAIPSVCPPLLVHQIMMSFIRRIDGDAAEERQLNSGHPNLAKRNGSPSRLRKRRRRSISNMTITLLLILAAGLATFGPSATVAAAAAATAAKTTGQGKALDSQAQVRPQQPEQVLLLQRRQQAPSPGDQLDSAHLPAEFRGLDDDKDDDEAPREQSKLAKLCQQTSSVLASVLPAPFGGHKRSILCQFFGQVPLQGKPAGGAIAVLQHGHQPPVTLPIAAGHHPIQLVLEHQRQQMQLQQKLRPASQQQQQQQMQMQLLRPGFAPVQLPASVQHQLTADLKSAASVNDYAYHQRLEPPPSMMRPQSGAIRFNQPLGAAASFRPLSMAAPALQSSTASSSQAPSSGWRIFNQSLVAGEQWPVSSTAAAPTFAASSTMARTGGRAKSIGESNDKRPNADGRQQNSSSTTLAPPPPPPPPRQQQSPPDSVTANEKLAMVDLHQAKPAISNSSSLSAGMATKRSEALKSSTRSLSSAAAAAATPTPAPERQQQQQQQVRIIEVTNNNTDGSPLVKDLAKLGDATAASASGAVIKLAKQLVPDTKKEAAGGTQRREELVIASINNLTRIAFGNQLRDTVKVINKLIDQQSDLFGGGERPKLGADQPQAESRRVVSVVSANSLDRSPAAASKGAQKVEAKAGDMNANTKSPAKVSSLARKTTAAAPSTTTATSAKTSAKPTKRPKKGDSLRLSPPGAQTSTSQRPRDGQRTTKALASSRLDLSRSLWSSSSPMTRKSYATTPKMLQQPADYATTIGDLHRDHSPWRRSRQPPGRLLSRPSPYAGVSPALTPIAVATTTTTSSSTPLRATLADWRSPHTYPWLLPDKSFSGSDLFQSMGGQSSERVSSTVEAPRQWHQSATAAAGGKQALVLNRLQEPEVTTKYMQQRKLDSLTTLKMSLTTTAAPSSSSKMIWTSPKEQSRWVPSTITAATAATAATTSTTSTTTTARPSTTLASASVSELIEARASDSISKYTSHWTNEANELLATTTRRLHRGEPMPQIAQTGEFFNAETIANWPERYQTMLEARSTPSLVGSSTGQQVVESTRRNGETYDTASTPARHRLDETTTTSKASTRSLAATLEPNLHVLPPNHKLTSTTATDQATTKPEEFSPEATKTYTSSPLTVARQTVSGPAVAYTLVGPVTQGDGEVHQIGDRFPLVSGDDEQVSTTKPPGSTNFASNFSALKAPYLQQGLSQEEDMMQQQQQQQQQPSAAPGRPYVSRKLYELLVPSTRHFVGAQNPLNQQRFNLSALKFLAQNLLSPATVNETGAESHLQANNGSANVANQHLIDLLESSDNYYDMLMNDTSVNGNNHTVQVNKTAPGGKSILGRAGNLLNELRQLEQKRAAAIMAAIRYQVPGPLVRPWDPNSDLFRQSWGPDDDRTLDSRNDKLLAKEEQEEPLLRNYLRDSLVVAQASKLIKTALTKQRLVSRDVLEARLNGKEVAFLDKRSSQDPNGAAKADKSSQLEVAYSFGDHDNQAGVFNGSRHDDADYKPLAQENYNHQYQNNRNFTRRWLDKLFNRANSSGAALNDKTISSRGDLIEAIGGEPEPARGAELDHQSVSAGGETSAKEQQVLVGKDDPDERLEKFDCSDKQAGFYPDTSSACQNFHHCSSTGHLLTFNCPQQTRFDERSLKCGPWFEITCDLTRNKHRRPIRFN